jgi:drug/metabolite transporter (DMT)-like permease
MDLTASVLALLSALSTALATTLQQRGALDTPAEGNDPRFFVQVLTQPMWLLGGVFMLLGWLFQAVALDRGVFVIVQTICSLSLVFALPLGMKLTNQKIGRRQLTGAVLALVGIIGFLVFGEPAGSIRKPDASTMLIWGLIALGTLIGLGWIAAKRRGPPAAALFGTAAGVSFGVQAAATKIFVGQLGNGVAVLVGLVSTYVLIFCALAGFALQQSALKTGFLAPAMAATNASALATSVLLGVVIFDDQLASSGHLGFALFSLAVSIVGVVILASASAPAEAPPSTAAPAAGVTTPS